MDDGKGKMEMYKDMQEASNAKARNPLAGGIFHKGEIVSIKSSQFRITQILPNGLKLALIPKETIQDAVKRLELMENKIKKGE